MKMKSISLRLLIWFAAVSLLPLLTVSLLLLNAFEEHQVESFYNYLSQVADMKANQIDSYINERLIDIQTLSKSADIIRSIEQLDHYYSQSGIDSPEYRQADASVRANYAPLLENLYDDLFFITPAGEIIFSLQHGTDFATNLFHGSYKNTALSDVVRNALSILSAEISEFHYYLPSREPTSFLAAPILKDGVLLGVLGLQISTRHIYAVIEDDTGLGETGEAVVARREGNKLVFMAPLKFDQKAAFKRHTAINSTTAEPMKHALRGERGSGIALDYRNEEVIAVWRYLPSLRWGLVVKRDTRTAFKTIRQLQTLGLSTLLLFMLLVIIIAYFMGRKIVLPIKILTRVSADIAAGNLGKRAEVYQDDEIGQLSRSFNHMADQLQHSQDQLEEQVARRTARLNEVNRSLRHEMDERIKVEDKLRLTSTVFEHTSEAIVITDVHSLIIDCNQAYTRITGYTLKELKGKNPSMSQSGFHDREFFQAMWQSIKQSGCWSGEIWDRRKNGEAYPKWLSINAVHNTEGKVSHYIGVFTDISGLKETEKKLEDLAFSDPLTGLPNRQLFNNRLEHEISRVHRHRYKVALLFIDLDHFKDVNDSLGHLVGDELLKVIAHRLQASVREEDTVARLGGDEFTIILAELKSVRVITDIAAKVIDVIRMPIILHDHELVIGASIGISIYPDDTADKVRLIRNADAAMYHAKKLGRNNFQFFSEDINQRNQQYRLLQESLRRAIKAEEFELYYQPQIDLSTKKVIGSEALIRWNDPHTGLVSPDQFIPTAEESGMILEIGAWVFRQACRQLRGFMEAGISPVSIAINLSVVQFGDEGLVDMIESVLRQENLSARWIELEITESAIMENAEKAADILMRLSTLGIRIAIDDFGTGYSSLAYLKKFHVDKLKVDREFIQGLPDNNNDVVLTTTMIQLANSLGIEVLAEGVETIEQIEFLRQHGCHYVQGYYYTRPLPADEFIAYILSNR